MHVVVVVLQCENELSGCVIFFAVNVCNKKIVTSCNFFSGKLCKSITRITAKKKVHNRTIFCTRVYRKKKLHDLTIHFYTQNNCTM